MVLTAAMLAMVGFALGRLTAPSSERREAEPARIAPLPRSGEAPGQALDGGFVPTSRASLLTVWEDRWSGLAASPGNARRDAALAALLEERARTDAAGALALAAAEPNRLRREKFQHASLRGWAERAPDAAADWVNANLAEPGRDAAIAAVIEGATSAPDAARQLVERLTRADPAQAYAYGHTLIQALAARGEFATAAQFATSSETEASARTEWINGAFSSWAQHQPKPAAQAALTLADPDARRVALGGVTAGWARAEPAGLAEFSLQLPAGAERSAALGESLRHWVMQDAVAASAWINRLESSAEIDAGAAAIATLQPLIANRPDVALGWAESIVEPELRLQTLGAVLQTWSLTDLAGAQRYLHDHPGAVEQMAAK
ncbi:MAG TPA: hypothetical protein VHO24_13120 [Opitutaceae bacterium]|nr:hypothetical protein [Opitutaceae bacterium]